ncbi:hypothetical protein Tco_1450415 [Tanacetum coccineum]
MLAEYNHYITFRADQQRITKINYRIDKVTRDETMRIERDNQPLSLIVIENFGLKQLGFSEWIEIQALASKVKGKATDTLLKNLKAKFEKRKIASEMLEEVFVKEDIKVDGMYRNLISPQVFLGSKGLVITEPELGIFFLNGNFDLVFQREEEFHLATTAQLIRLQNGIQRVTPEAEDMYMKLDYAIVARNNVDQARIIVRDNLDNGRM